MIEVDFRTFILNVSLDRPARFEKGRNFFAQDLQEANAHYDVCPTYIYVVYIFSRDAKSIEYLCLSIRGLDDCYFNNNS